MSKEKPIMCKALDYYETDKLIDGLTEKVKILSKTLKSKSELRDREEIARMIAELTVLLEMLAIEYRVEELTGYWHLIVLSMIAKDIKYGK
jgi:hypothetical protein